MKLLCVLICTLAFAAPAAASPGQFTLFEAPRELTSGDAALRSSTLDELDGLGVRWLRTVLYWRDVAPAASSPAAPEFDDADPDAGYDWTRYDRLIGEARARGMNVLVTVSGPVPKWATASKRSYLNSPSPTHFRRFMTAVGRRYGGQVSAWSVWNEPNHPAFLGPQFRKRRGKTYAYSPVLYRKLFFAADAGLRAAGRGGDRLLMGETAPRGTGRVVAPLRFLRGSLCLTSRYRRARRCSRAPADGYAHHAYTTGSGPSFRPRNPDDVTIGVLSRLTRALDRAGRAGVIRRGIRVYLTEFGIQSKPDPYIGVSYAKQAEYRSISERIAYRNRRVAAFSQYLMRDDEPRAGSASQRYSGFESGLRRSTGEAKPAYDAFRLPLVADLGSRGRVALWGLVRPHAGETRVTIEVRRKGSRTWRRLKSDATSSRGYWSTSTRHRSGTRYRVRWGSYAGPATRAYR